jgi:hypothetical protein
MGQQATTFCNRRLSACKGGHRVSALTALLVCGFWCAFVGASAAHEGQPVTQLEAVISAAQVEVSPGLCFADTPFCSNAIQDQVHIYSQACSATGVFEGRALSDGAQCGIDLTAFMDPSFGFATPNCVTTRTYTSDKARAFGKPVNAVTIDGVSRKLELGYPFAVMSSRTGIGWMDGPDRNLKPTGDYRLVLSIQVRPHQGAPLG